MCMALRASWSFAMVERNRTFANKIFQLVGESVLGCDAVNRAGFGTQSKPFDFRSCLHTTTRPCGVLSMSHGDPAGKKNSATLGNTIIDLRSMQYLTSANKFPRSRFVSFCSTFERWLLRRAFVYENRWAFSLILAFFSGWYLYHQIRSLHGGGENTTKKLRTAIWSCFTFSLRVLHRCWLCLYAQVFEV